MSAEICEPRWERCPVTGKLELYQCGRSLLYRDPANPAQACPGGTYICLDCIDDFEEFMTQAYDARARRKEWET